MHIRRSAAESSDAQPRLGRLCEVAAAAAISPGRRRHASPGLSSECTETRAGTPERAASKFKVIEVDAFASVQDMIHAAIASYGAQATLREIYTACQQHGRIAYKRSGGSRLIAHNEHWKSQIRHALYTGDRFARAETAHDLWTVSAAFDGLQPQTTKVLVRTDPSAACVNDDTATPPRRQKLPPPAKAPARAAAKAPARAAIRARGKHPSDEPVIQPTTRQKRSRTTRAAARRPVQVEPAAVESEEEDQSGLQPGLMPTPSGSVAVSNRPGQQLLPNSDYSDLDERGASVSALQAYAHDTNTTSTPLLQHEGEDESSHNDTCVQVLPEMYTAGRMPVSYEPDYYMPANQQAMMHTSFSHMPVMDVHPFFTECLDAHQIVANSMAASQPQTPSPASHTHPSCYRAPHSHREALPVLDQSMTPSPTPRQPPCMPQRLSPHGQCHMHSLGRAPSVEADSPAESQVYALRSRLAPRVSTGPVQLPAGIAPRARASDYNAAVAAVSPAAARQPYKVPTRPRSMLQPASPIPESRACSSLRSESPLSSPSVNYKSAVSPGLTRPAASPSNRTHLLLAAAQRAQADDHEFKPHLSRQTEQSQVPASQAASHRFMTPFPNHFGSAVGAQSAGNHTELSGSAVGKVLRSRCV